jgi:peptidyl-prolyl cis-trans isomerase C
MSRKSLKYASLLLLPILLSSCHKSSAPLPDSVLAKVGNTTISQGDLKKKLDSMGLASSKDPNVTSELLNQMVDNSLLAMQARKEGLDKTPEFKKKMHAYETKLLRKALLKKDVDDKVKVTDSDIVNYYNKHQKDIKQPGYVDVRQVVFPDEKTAKRDFPLLKKKGGFKKVTKMFKGGPVGKIYEGTVPPKFVSFFFGVPEGSITGPIPLKDGIHYFKIDRSVKGVQLTLDQAREGIRNYLRNRQNKTIYQTLVNHLRSTTTVQINNKALVSMISRAANAKSPAPDQIKK